MRTLLITAAVLAFVTAGGCASLNGDRAMQADRIDWEQGVPREEPFAIRPLATTIDGEWIGTGVSYGPHREGQHPTGEQPTREQLREDLHIMSQHWNMLRVYGARGAAETLLQIIREEKLNMRIMVGAWIDSEAIYDESGVVIKPRPEAIAANHEEVATAIRLANEYPDLVAAISIGNETQVFWSFHKTATANLIEYVRLSRAQTNVPVTVCDDYLYWLTPESRNLARELDFVVMHVYPLWRGQQLDNAMPFTQAEYAKVTAMHPDRLIVIGEAGWATSRLNHGQQAELMKGKAGEDEQVVYYNAFTKWTRDARIPTFYFEAFDEPWKGGNDPAEAEKHWGLYNADRTPKKALR